MIEAIKLLESNELMRHLILFKLYIESNGRAMKSFYDTQKSIAELYGKNYDHELYLDSVRYLKVNKDYIDRNAKYLTYYGLDYTENWIKSFENLSEDEQDKLNTNLPKPIFDFFKFTKETSTVLNFINQMIKLAEKL